MMKTNLKLSIDRTLSGGIARQLSVFILFILIVLLSFRLLFLLFDIPLSRADTGDEYGTFWNLLYFFSDGGSQTNAVTGNRLPVYLLSIFGSVLLGGVLISTLSNIFERRVEKVASGKTHYRLAGHLIVVGYRPATVGLIIQLGNDSAFGRSPILLQTTADVASVRNSLQLSLSRSLMQRVIIYQGSRISPEDIAALQPEKAVALYLLGDEGEADCDALHANALARVGERCAVASRLSRLPTITLFFHPSTVTAFQRGDLSPSIREQLELTPLIYHEQLASALLADNCTGLGGQTVPPLDRISLVPESDHYVHLVVAGMNDMGVALGMKAAQIAHFPNYRKRKSVITFIDEEAGSKMEQLFTRYPYLFEVVDHSFMKIGEDDLFIKGEKERCYAYLGDLSDLEFRFVEGSPQSTAVHSLFDSWASDENALLSIAVCGEDAPQSVSWSIHMPGIIFDRQIPIFVFQEEPVSIMEAMADNGRYANIYPFGMVSRGVPLHLRTLHWAKRLNWVYSCFFSEGRLPEPLPDELSPFHPLFSSWHKLSIADQWSNISHAESFPAKLRVTGRQPGTKITPFTPDEKEMLAEVEHNRWMTERLMIGYRPATVEERALITADPERKKSFKKRLVHVDICRYEELLPDAQGNDVREYDRILVDALPMIVT